MKISDRRLRISDSLKISDFSNSLGVLQHPQQYAYAAAADDDDDDESDYADGSDDDESDYADESDDDE